MAAASYLQTSFLGGQWSPYAQGRADQETYRTAMNKCLNGYPIAVGAWTRRQGTLFGAPTRNGVLGVVRPFHFAQAQPYALEFTAGHMRLWAGDALVLENQHVVGSISKANPAVVATVNPHGLSTGDQVEFQATLLTPGNTTNAAAIAPLFNRQFAATVVDTTHFSIADPVTGATIDGTTINTVGWLIKVSRVVDYAVPYTATDLQNIRVVQNESVALVLCAGFAPRMVVNTGTDAAPVLAFQTVTFKDGPYLDPPTDGSTITASAASGSVTLTASAITSINGGLGFQTTDVGRSIRLFSEPAAWASGTTYAAGATVKFNNAYYYSLISGNAGHQPDVDNGTRWGVATTAAAWTWAVITARSSTTVVTATIQGADPLGFLAGGALVNGTQAVSQWRLGLYTDTGSVYPTGGTFHEGRFWLFSGLYNRLDASMANNYGTLPQTALQFAPTGLDGTVADDDGISAVMEGTDKNPIFWAVSTETGIVVGTQGGEWNIMASASDDPITPTSIQAKRKTRYGCANIEPVVAPLATLFVQRYQRHLYEYISDVYSRKFTGTNLAEKAQDTILPGIAELAWQATPNPICWARTTDNRLVGMSYKRESPFGTQPASFYGWHTHTLGSDRQVVSLRGGPAPSGNTDSITMVTLDTVTGIYFVEFLSPFFDETNTILQADFVDAAVTPSSAIVSGNNVIFYGLEYIAGKTVSTFIGGVDGGDFTVAADGSLTVPINTAGSLLTSAYLASLTGSYGSLSLSIQVTPPGSGFYSPVGAALNFTTSSVPSGSFDPTLTAVFDWDAGRLYHQIAAHAGDPATNNHSLFIFDLATHTQVSGPLDPGTGSGAGANLPYSQVTCLGYDGHIYYGTATATSLLGRWNTGTHTNDLVYNDTHSLAQAGYLVAIKGSDGEYLLGTGINSGTGGGSSAPWYLVNMTGVGGPAFVAGGSFDEGNGSITVGNAFPCRGPAGLAFVCALGQLAPYSGAVQLGVYVAAIDGPTVGGVGKIGVVTPAQIHGGWTTMGMQVPVYDETDGNIISVFNSGGVHVMAKISTRDASVLWTLVLTAADVGFRTSRIRGGRLSYLDGSGSPWTLKEINTLTGVVDVASPTEAVIGPNYYSTDDKAGQVVLNVGSNAATEWQTFGPANGGGAITPAVVYTAPTIIGFTYTSDGQILRAIAPAEAGTQEGPALGKTRRAARSAWLFSNTQGVSLGTVFTDTQTPLRNAAFSTAGGAALSKLTLFSGIYRDELEDDYTFDSMPCWRITRPFPATVNAVEPFVHTQDLH